LGERGRMGERAAAAAAAAERETTHSLLLLAPVLLATASGAPLVQRVTRDACWVMVVMAVDGGRERRGKEASVKNTLQMVGRRETLSLSLSPSFPPPILGDRGPRAPSDQARQGRALVRRGRRALGPRGGASRESKQKSGGKCCCQNSTTQTPRDERRERETGCRARIELDRREDAPMVALFSRGKKQRGRGSGTDGEQSEKRTEAREGREERREGVPSDFWSKRRRTRSALPRSFST
jgi:hypothetical protein